MYMYEVHYLMSALLVPNFFAIRSVNICIVRSPARKFFFGSVTEKQFINGKRLLD